MTKEDQKQQAPASPQQIVVPEVYTNTAIVNFSPYEFELTFGLGSSNYQGIKPLVNVRMSPQFAKEFARIISENVKMYEQNIGAIVEVEQRKKN
ncbi:MAG: DUF3467 domain-containing protein [Spirochaetes bacterium]|nr:MAG: DUF3467 domain-containing protein [Spirochaetota bacterium]